MSFVTHRHLWSLLLLHPVVPSVTAYRTKEQCSPSHPEKEASRPQNGHSSPSTSLLSGSPSDDITQARSLSGNPAEKQAPSQGHLYIKPSKHLYIKPSKDWRSNLIAWSGLIQLICPKLVRERLTQTCLLEEQLKPWPGAGSSRKWWSTPPVVLYMEEVTCTGFDRNDLFIFFSHCKHLQLW